MFGILIFHEDRPDIALENGTLYGGLHCGDCFCCYHGGWLDVRLEYAEGWVLIGQGERLPVQYGAQVRI